MSYGSGSYNVRRPLPQAVVEASLRGNTYYPQRYAGAAIMAGHVIFNLVLSGREEWPAIVHGSLSEAQLGRAVTDVHTAHKAFGIPFRLGESFEAVDREHEVFTLGRLAAVVGGFMPVVLRATADYSRVMLGLGEPYADRDLLMSYLTPAERQQRMHEYSEASEELFVLQKNGSFRPETVAFGAMWRAAAETIEPCNPAARAISQRLLHAYGDLYNSDRGYEAHVRAFAVLDAADDSLHELVRTGVEVSLPRISQQAGVVIPHPVAERFVDTVAPAAPDH